MAKKKQQRYSGVVYSTDPDYSYTNSENEVVAQALPPEEERLKIRLDKKQRRGKQVTLIEGFGGLDSDLDQLAKRLKQRCGVGGAVKDRCILLQGDFREIVLETLRSWGYVAKIIG